ncbi:MAG: hypothetical protein ACOX9C_12970 [Kiritimatiellia bacterium]|jgi:hypothetical protein
MVEFVIAIIGVLVVAAGILLLAELHRADADTFVEASAEAISDSMDLSIASSFTPIRDWSPGADGLRHTKDDQVERGSFSSARTRIASRSAPAGDWSGLERLDGESAHYNDIRRFSDGEMDTTTFRFHRGANQQTVETPLVLRSLLGLPETMTLRNEAWMPSTGGLYD